MSVWNYLNNIKAGVYFGLAYLFPKYFQNMSLTPLANLEELSPLVFRVLGCNPGPYTLQGTNTYLIGTGKEKILVDTGNPNVSEYTSNLRTALSEHLGQSQISAIVCSHWHHDHVGGINDVISSVIGREIPVYKFERQAVSEEKQYCKHGYEYVPDDHVFRTEGATLRALYTPGHTDDHIALYLEEEKAIFSGDCILGEGTAVFEDLYSYMKSLERLLGFKPQRIYPGHGPVIEEPVAKIQEYIDHRNMRERQILDYLASVDGPKSAMDIVNGVYEELSLPLKYGAANNVKHHLSKLVKDKKVEKLAADSWKLAKIKSEL